MAQYPIPGGGVQLDDAFIAAMIDNWVIKAADSTPRTAATLVSDPDLTFPVVANATYDVEFMIRWAGLQVAGLRTGWAVPSGTTGNRLSAGPGTANAVEGAANTTEMRWAINSYATAVGYTNPRNSTTSQTWSWEKGLVEVGGTAGSVTLQWGQFAANATGSIIMAKSYVRYRRVG